MRDQTFGATPTEQLEACQDAVEQLVVERDAALARAETAEARVAEAEGLLLRLHAAVEWAARRTLEHGDTAFDDDWRALTAFLAGAPAAPPPVLPLARRCGWCGGHEDELADPHGPCPLALDTDPQTGEPYVCGPHQYVETAAAPPPPSLPPEVQRVLGAAEGWARCADPNAPDYTESQDAAINACDLLIDAVAALRARKAVVSPSPGEGRPEAP